MGHSSMAAILLIVFSLAISLFMSISFGKETQIQLVFVLCSFGIHTYYSYRKKIIWLLFIISILLFCLVSLLNIPPLYVLSKTNIFVISSVLSIVFCLVFSYKMWGLLASQKLRILEEEEDKRKKMLEIQLQLQNKNNLLQLIIDNLPQYIFWKNNDGQFLGSNQSFAKKMGAGSPEDLKWKKEEDFADTSDIPPAFITHKKEAFLNGSFIYNLEEEFTSKKGNKVWYKSNRIPLFEKDRKHLGILYTFENISEQKINENKKREAENRLKYFFEASPLGIVFRDLASNKLVLMNPKFRALLGLGDESIQTINRLEFTQYEDQEHLEMMISKLLAGEINSFKMEKQYRRVDGSVFWARITRSLISMGNTPYILGFVEDINQQVKAKNALIQNESKYRSLFENGFDGIVVFDIQAVQIIDVNRRILEYFKLDTKEEFLNRDVLDFSPVLQPNGRSSEDALAEILKRTDHEDRFEFVWMHLLDDGTKLYTSVYTFRNPEQPHLYTSIYKDITHEKRQEETIQQQLAILNVKNQELEKYIESNMQLENFAYVASHDLKGPIRTMVSFSQLLSRKTKGKLNEDETEYLDFIISASKNMQLLIDDLLMYSRVDTKKIQLTSLEFPDLLDDIFFELAANVQEKNAKIELQNIPDSILADRTRIRQLFQNLVANAIKFIPAERTPRIHISCKEESKQWHFSIQDNGIGIDPEYHEKIFLLFKKLHANEQYEGTGIGLAMCKKIVDQHKGKIWVESKKGNGTTFHFTIKKF